MIRVLIVDDSPIARVVLKKMVDSSPGMEVVGSANHGEEALEVIPKLQPHVVCTDLHMPKMDGLHLTREIMRLHPLPILVVSISVHQDADDHNIFELLEAGAIDVFPKPRGGLASATEALTRELATKIKILSGVVPIRRHQRNYNTDPSHQNQAGVSSRHTTHPKSHKTTSTVGHISPAPPLPRTSLSRAAPAIIAIGASTGGPQALLTILSALPGRFPLPVICIQHISHGFLEEMVSWLDSHTPLAVKIGQNGEQPQPGTVYFPEEDKHLTIKRDGRFAMESGSANDLHRPSVDITFQSLARIHKDHGIAVQLTGMGRDGADGMLAISQARGTTIAQDEATSVVFGMPKQAIDLGAVKEVLPIDDIAPALCRLAGVGSTSKQRGAAS